MASARELWATADAAIRARDWARAEAALLALRGAAPRDPRVHFNLGLLMKETGRLEAVASCWRQALAADPGYLPAAVNLGIHMAHLGQMDEAVRYAEMAVGLDPCNAGLLRNLATSWILANDHERALVIVERGLKLFPGDFHLRRLRMQVLEHEKRTQGLQEAVDDVMRLRGADPAVDAISVALGLRADVGDWAGIAALDAVLAEGLAHPRAAANPCSLAFHVDDPAALAHLATNEIAKRPPPKRPPWRRKPGMITVAYVSPDLRNHPVAQMLLEVLRHHDRDRVRVILVALRASDDSPIAREIAVLADTLIDLSSSDPHGFAERMRTLEVDVLVDLAGRTMGSRPSLLERRSTPVQVLWLGSPVTTGMHHYDAFLLDAVVAPPGYEAWCSEPLLRLPVCYHPISLGLGEGPSSLTRADLGLPSGALVVGLQQHVNRVRPPFIDRLAGVIGNHPEAHLWLKVKPEQRSIAIAYLERFGLPAKRVHFADFYPARADYFQALRLIDLFVDTHPYGGHSTTGEVLALGRPVAAAAGACIHSRVAASMLVELGLGDLVAPSQDALFAQVDRLLADPALLAAWRQRFATAAAQPAAARHRRLAAALEDAYAHLLATAPEPPP